MTETDLAQAAERLARAEEKFLTTVRMLIESMQAMTEIMKGNRDHFQAQVHSFDATEELMNKQLAALREITAGMELIIKGCGSTNETLTETNARMNAVLTKLESYFGNPSGLEFEN